MKSTFDTRTKTFLLKLIDQLTHLSARVNWILREQMVPFVSEDGPFAGVLRREQLARE